jgi:hypothetical protein
MGTTCSVAALVAGGVVVRLLASGGNEAVPRTVVGSRAGTFSGVELPVRVHRLLASGSPGASAQTDADPVHPDGSTVADCVLKGPGDPTCHSPPPPERTKAAMPM